MPIDHELKLMRAFRHLQDLDRQVLTWLDADNHSIRYEYDRDAVWSGPIPPGPADEGIARYYLAGPVFIPGQGGPGTAPTGVTFGQGLLTAFATAEQPPTDPISLLLGDALHNMRSALDNLAFALGSAFTKPLPEEYASQSEFPIFGDADRQGRTGVGKTLFHARDKRNAPARGSGLAKIHGWHPDAQAVVEGLQPYHRGEDFRSDPLWLLHELDRFNKHRLLHTATAMFAGTAWNLEQFRNVRCIGPGFIESSGGPLETDTPIGRICGIHPIDPDAEMHVEIRPALYVAFSHQTAVATTAPVTETLRVIYDHIVRWVLPPLTPFL